MRLTFAMLFLVATFAMADGPEDNFPDKVKRIPPIGVKLDPTVEAELQTGVKEFGEEIQKLQTTLKNKPALLELLPDVQVFYNAVKYPLQYNEFFNAKEGDTAKNLLKIGRERAKSLAEGKAPWTTATDLVVRGYVSKIDGSVQPYGLVIPATLTPNTAHKYRLDFWCHGRGETLSELSFVQQRLTNRGEFVPPNTIVLHLYGRYCNANKFAGEIDLLEALEHVKKHYPIDENRIVIRGFSMGGAACWQFAVHYPSLFVAAAPGAGFSETPEFLRVFQKEIVQPTWYEKKLYHMYDCPDSARNLLNLPTVAYSGDEDNQKQAADIMGVALEKEGLSMTHIIGPQTKHSYHRDSKVEINRRIDAIAARGRNPIPERVSFTTYTLRYDRSYWVKIDGLQQHWERGRVEAVIDSPKQVSVTTEGVTAFTLDMLSGYAPLDPFTQPKVLIDGQSLLAPKVETDVSWTASFHKDGDKWKVGAITAPGVRKVHGLTGPIDDAFMDSFIMVRPTGPGNPGITKWVGTEMEHAITHWRRQFRGEARVKDDKDVTEIDIASSNLILWGDPKSNAIIAKIADRLPIAWTPETIQIGDSKYPSAEHTLVAIYPNPLNPKKYIVLNSGFTFREYDYLNNARQVSKLPDFAVVDVRVPMSSRFPGKVVMGGFFDESWKLPKEQK